MIDRACHPSGSVTDRQAPNLRQFLRFAVIGAGQNLTNLAVFATERALGVALVPAALLAAAGGLAVSFTLNRRWTFPGSEGRTRARVVRYLVVWLGCLAVALVALVLLVEVAHLPSLLAQVLILAVLGPLSYLVQRGWTFRPASAFRPANEDPGAGELVLAAPPPDADYPAAGGPPPSMLSSAPGVAAGDHPFARQ